MRAVTHGNGIWEIKLASVPTSVEIESNGIPKEFLLKQNFPNPFNPVTRIDFAVAKQSYIKINVYDLSGKLVKTLVDKQHSAGNYYVNFDSNGLSSGVYFYSMIIDGKLFKTSRMTLLK
jgi:hypothetical protein